MLNILPVVQQRCDPGRERMISTGSFQPQHLWGSVAFTAHLQCWMMWHQVFQVKAMQGKGDPDLQRRVCKLSCILGRPCAKHPVLSELFGTINRLQNKLLNCLFCLWNKESTNISSYRGTSKFAEGILICLCPTIHLFLSGELIQSQSTWPE